MRLAVVQFPASNCDQDALHVLRHVFGQDADYVWHKDTDLHGAEAVILPGGFSYGDYLRCGAIARFSPVMESVRGFAAEGGLVLGVCNGFQVLCEAGLLPGALIRNRSLEFRCEHVFVRTRTRRSAFTRAIPENRVLRIPIAHADGCFFADDATLVRLREKDQILWEYCDRDGALSDEANPNGSLFHIAGICNEGRNVAGLMPHPERACESILGGEDGRFIFESLLAELDERRNDPSRQRSGPVPASAKVEFAVA